MLSVNEIARHCASRTLARGRQIEASGRDILTKQCRYRTKDTVISAFVISSSGWADRYRVSITVDEEADRIIDYSCTCPAYLKYAGLCKHAAAVALTFSSKPESFLGYEPSRAPETSPSLMDFMRKIERGTSDEPRGGISIETTLSYGYENWSAHFRLVGPRGAYVMKSISEFVEHVRRGEHVSYGKKLAFTHSIDAFDERSKNIVRFLTRAVSQREQQGSSSPWRMQANAVSRSISLTEAEAIELIDLNAHAPFPFESDDYGLRSTMTVHVAEDNPPIELRIIEEDGGYSIMRDDDIVFAASEDRMYVLVDDILYKCTPEFARSADFFRSVWRARDEQLFVAQDDMGLFCSTILPLLESSMHVKAPEDIERFRPIECQLEFYFDKSNNLIELRANARYGSSSVILSMPPSYVPAPHEGEGPASRRNEALENRARALIREYFYQDSTISLSDDEAAGRLLFGGLAVFQAMGTVYTTPAFDRLISDRKPRMQMGLSIAGNLINLDTSSEDLPMAELAAMLSSYRKKKRYHRMRGGAFIDLASFDLAQLDRLAEDLDLSPRDIASGHIEIPTYKAFYLDRELKDARRDESFTRYITRFKQIDQSSYRVPESLTGTLRSYQVEGFKWLSALVDMGFGGILADEMGLGKSIQLISMLLDRADKAREVGPSLIVCPASLVYNWIAEFERFAPSLKVRAIVGSKRERELIREDAECEVFITSYDLLRIDAKSFEQKSYWCHALDEAQYIKNHTTLTTRAIKRVKSKHRFALTGTPVENRLSELWSIFDFLMPGFLGSYMRFRERYELAILGGDEDTSRRLQALVGPFILRRCKQDVLPDLPDKLESVIYVPLAGEQRRLYAAHEQKLRVDLAQQKKEGKQRAYGGHSEELTRVEVLAELTKLRQICCDPGLLYENYRGQAAKIGAIVDLVNQARDAGKKVLLFSQFTSFLARLAEELDAEEIPYYTITGSTPKKKRLDLVNAFNEDATPVFLISLKAGGTGLNLIGAQVVVHADPWWNAAAQNQATDRAHRIGQTKTVDVYRVIAKDTIEERIVKLQESKAELADQLMSGSGLVSLGSLSREDLMDLLEG